jgi:hypothetical protein
VTTPPPAPYAGRYGTAEPIPYDPAAPGCTETVAYWLLTAGIYHPLWHQYALAVVRLRDAPGYPPPVLRYPDATHELLVMALDPTSPDDPANPGARVTYTPQALEGLAAPYLQPINIAEQFTATEDEAAQVAQAAARAVVDGHINPETGDAPTYTRAGWHAAVEQCLAHLRGEHQA